MLGASLTLPSFDLSMIATASFSPLMLAETAVAAVIVSAGVGSWAKGMAQEAKNKEARRQAEEDSRFYIEYDRLIHRVEGGGLSNAPVRSESEEERLLDEERLLWLWSETDWRRWEKEEHWNWEPKAKMKEAETLWRKILARPIDRMKEREQRRLAAERAQQEQEEGAQTGNGGGGSGARRQRRFPAGGQHSSQGPRDFLGYYKLLGIDLLTLPKGQDMDVLIKQRFKLKAMELHPDRQAGKIMTEEESKLNNVKYQKMQIAYEVLRDVEKRQAYDKGRYSDS